MEFVRCLRCIWPEIKEGVVLRAAKREEVIDVDDFFRQPDMVSGRNGELDWIYSHSGEALAWRRRPIRRENHLPPLMSVEDFD